MTSAPKSYTHYTVIQAGDTKITISQEAAEQPKLILPSVSMPARNPLDIMRAPVKVKVAANGERLPDTASGHVAVWMPELELEYDARLGLVADTWEHALKLGAACNLFDGKGWQLWDDYEAMATFDRSRSDPATDTNFFPHSPTDYIYWTRTPHPSSAGNAIYVHLSLGSVNWSDRGSGGRVRAVRRVPASQFGVLAGGL